MYLAPFRVRPRGQPYIWISSGFATLLGARGQSPTGIDSPLLVPFPTNVYTVYKFFFTDFGMSGMFITISGHWVSANRHLLAGLWQAGDFVIFLCAPDLPATLMSHPFADESPEAPFFMLKASLLAVFISASEPIVWEYACPDLSLGSGLLAGGRHDRRGRGPLST